MAEFIPIGRKRSTGKDFCERIGAPNLTIRAQNDLCGASGHEYQYFCNQALNQDITLGTGTGKPAGFPGRVGRVRVAGWKDVEPAMTRTLPAVYSGSCGSTLRQIQAWKPGFSQCNRHFWDPY
ncbi:hypothetical protein B0H13DRAFT_1854878 [Mycena leptocephala]|nr:hypothetical protein B0H13DRAFT_1854878 [Mycena leptocephala]